MAVSHFRSGGVLSLADGWINTTTTTNKKKTRTECGKIYTSRERTSERPRFPSNGYGLKLAASVGIFRRYLCLLANAVAHSNAEVPPVRVTFCYLL